MLVIDTLSFLFIIGVIVVIADNTFNNTPLLVVADSTDVVIVVDTFEIGNISFLYQLAVIGKFLRDVLEASAASGVLNAVLLELPVGPLQLLLLVQIPNVLLIGIIKFLVVVVRVVYLGITLLYVNYLTVQVLN